MESIKVVFAILMIQNGSTIEMVPTVALATVSSRNVLFRNIGEERRNIHECKS